jgi:hypothetical protein
MEIARARGIVCSVLVGSSRRARSRLLHNRRPSALVSTEQDDHAPRTNEHAIQKLEKVTVTKNTESCHFSLHQQPHAYCVRAGDRAG